MSIDDRLTTLDALWSVWAATGKDLTDADWHRPTRLEGWDLRALWAHSAGWPFGFSILVGRVTDAAPTHDTAAALLAEFNVPDGIANTTRDRVAEAGRDDANRYTVDQLVDQFATTGPQAIAQARGLGEVAPYFVDADAQATAAGGPIGGLTVIAFPNNHLVYALTWYALALMVAGATWTVVRQERRRAEEGSPDGSHD